MTRAQKWVRSRRYPIVLADVRLTILTEQPDVIGFRSGGDSLLVECKASVEDFRRDAKKPFRQHSALGMGFYRWYFSPAEVIPREEVPAGWGLITCHGRRLNVEINAQPFTERNLVEENRLLVTALRRATEGWGRRMFGDQAPPAVDGDPSPSTAMTIRKLREHNERLKKQVRALTSEKT